MGLIKAPFFFFFSSVFLLLILISCQQTQNYSHYLCGDQENQRKLNFLFETLKKQDSSESRFIINFEIYRIMTSLNQSALLNAYFLEQVQWYPEDPCNGYYLNMIASYYQSRKMPQMAEIYYKRIVRNHPAIEANGQSIEQNALSHLSRICIHPDEKILYPSLLIEKYSTNEELAPIYSTLAKGYEELGDWSSAIQAWKKFLKSPYAGIQGEENLRRNISNKVRFYEYENKNWVSANLDTLVGEIRWAIRTKNDEAIERKMSKVDFFTLSWAEDEREAKENFLSGLSSFIRQPILFKAQAERTPNDKEAYWETSQWRWQIPRWYLYFRRIDFPADPSIHGKWEWAGIYFGEKPFKDTE